MAKKSRISDAFLCFSCLTTRFLTVFRASWKVSTGREALEDSCFSLARMMT